MWIPQGPAPATGGQVRNVFSAGQVSGAIHTVLAHPEQAESLYIGSVNGGIWKTTSALADNPIWDPLTDDLPSLSISALAFDAADTSFQTIVGGIGHYSSFGRTGGELSGLLRTVDGGSSWETLGGTDLQGRNISGVVAQGNMLLVTANRFGGGVRGGVYRSTDGGSSFQYLSGTSGLPLGDAYDLAADPTRAGRYYLAIAETGIFRSEDGGESWANVTTLDTSEGGLFEAVTVSGNNNIEMAIAGNGRLYAGVSIDGQTTFIGYSDDQGASWTGMDLPRTPEDDGDIEGLNPRVKPGGQGAIHFSIAVDPADPNIVYVGGDRQAGPFPNFIGANEPTGRLFRGDTTVSATGDAPSPQWEHLTHRSTIAAIPEGGTARNSAPHADSREIVFDAQGDLIEVDDGGIYRRTFPQSNAGDWFSVNGNLAVTEFHSIAYDSNSDIIVGGAQDTGTLQQRTPSGTVWHSISTADGGDVAIDDSGTDGISTRYTSFQHLAGFRRRSYDAGNNLIGIEVAPLTVLGGGVPVETQFVTPVALNAVDADRLIVGGANSVYESVDRGDTLWEIGPGIGVNPVAIAAGGWKDGEPNAEILYIGSGNQVFTRQAADVSLQPTPAAFPGKEVRGIALDPHDWMTAFVIDATGIFQTTDGGAEWTDVTGNLIDASLRTVEWIGSATATVAVGGLHGVFAMSLDRAGIWGSLGETLPSAPVLDLDYDAADDVLVAGTQGRGAFLLAEVSQNVPQVEPEILVRPATETMTTSEAGREATFQISLTAEPAEAIAIPIASGGPLEGTVDVAEVVFDRSDWYLPQTVTITGVDDDVSDGDATYAVVLGPAASTTGADPIFHALDPEDLSVVNIDDEGAGYLYWVDQERDLIQRANSDGSDVRTVIDLRARLNRDDDQVAPHYLAVDEEARNLYWTDSTGGEIWRAGLSGEGAEALISGLPGVHGIAVDAVAQKIYWVDAMLGTIQRANLNGTEVEDLVAEGVAGSGELELDLGNGKIVWADQEHDSIRRANLDGTGVEVWVRDLGTDPTGIALDVETQNVFWSDIVDGRIVRADLGANNLEEILDLRELVGQSGVGALTLDHGEKIYWSDAETGTLYRANLDGTGAAALAVTQGQPQGLELIEQRPGIRVIAPRGIVTNESAGTTTVEVTLDAPPTTAVTVPMTSNDSSEGVVITDALTFDSTNWNVPQVAVIEGVDDSEGDGTVEYSINFGPPVSADSAYDMLPALTFDATNLDNDSSLSVTSVTPTSTGFVVQFNEPFDPQVLNVYDAEFSDLGPPDLELRGEATGPVRGSLALDASYSAATFIKTAGILEPDTYHLVLKSGLDQFATATGIALDGDGDAIEGGDYLHSFTVTPPPAGAVRVGIPDLVRGPAQSVGSVETSGTGLPLTISDGTGIRAVDLRIDYDPALLNIDSVTLEEGLPEGTSIAVDNTIAGSLAIQLFSPTPLAAGSRTLARIQATVPAANANEIYGHKQVLDIHSITISGDIDPVAIDDDSLHVVLYPSDVSGNGRANAHDASLVARVAAESDDGFSATKLADPVIAGDVTGNGEINAADASQVAQHVALIDVDTIPPIPPGVVTLPIALGPDPRISFPKDIIASPGDSIKVPLQLDSIVNLQAPNRLIGADLVVRFDPNVLSATSLSAGPFFATYPDWSIVPNVDNTNGRIAAIVFSPTPVAGQFSDVLVEFNFVVKADAPPGPTAINLVEQDGSNFTDLVDESDGFLVLEGPVTNAPDDPVDGLVTIISDSNFEWTNPTNRLDVDDNGVVASNDVLVTVNEINLRRIIDSSNRLPTTRAPDQFFYDVDSDGVISPLDVLEMVNHLNFGGSGEGEAGDSTVGDQRAFPTAHVFSQTGSAESPRRQNERVETPHSFPSGEAALARAAVSLQASTPHHRMEVAAVDGVLSLESLDEWLEQDIL